MPDFITAVLKTYNATLSYQQHGAMMVLAATGRRAVNRRQKIAAKSRVDSGAMPMPPKPPNPIDVHVGKRIRMRRVERKMSTITLGEAIGLTFQQIQKYEKGTNRIGASRIQQICNVLEIPPSFVFEGAPGSTSHEGASASRYFADLMCSAEGTRLVEAFGKITDPDVRRDIARMVSSIADSLQSKKADGD
jgi:transcriptional regulator with XRE-family HTH domain